MLTKQYLFYVIVWNLHASVFCDMQICLLYVFFCLQIPTTGLKWLQLLTANVTEGRINSAHTK